MITETQLVIILLLAFGFVFGYIFAYCRQPPTWAYILRRLLGKNYVLLLLRARGGQLKLVCAKYDATEINYGGKVFTPIEENANYFGSVPCYAFDEKDCTSIPFRAFDEKTTSEYLKVRDPVRLHNVFMIMKAIYETLANKRNKYLLYAIILLSILIVISLALNYMNLQKTNEIADALKNIITQTTNTTNLPNMIR